MTRRAILAEALGSFLLFATVIGSGIMGERLAGGSVAIALLGNTIATGAILFVLITMLGPVSGAHFNPAVTLVMRLRREISSRVAMAFVAAQLGGGILGVWVAHLMFDLPIPIARSLSDSFAGIAPACVPGFIAAQLVGAIAALLVGSTLFARSSRET